MIRVGDHRIGIDKISHMASRLHPVYEQDQPPDQNRLLASASAESGTYGTDVSGIFLMDMAANSAGIQF